MTVSYLHVVGALSYVYISYYFISVTPDARNIVRYLMSPSTLVHSSIQKVYNGSTIEHEAEQVSVCNSILVIVLILRPLSENMRFRSRISRKRS